MKEVKAKIERLVDRAVKNFENSEFMTTEELNEDWSPREKPEYKIEDWYLHTWGECLYWLEGYITGHSRVGPEDHAHTSKLIKIDFGTMRAETKNSIYKLGKFYSRAEMTNNIINNKDEIESFFKDNFPDWNNKKGDIK